MDKVWLIRTKANHILGPVSKNKIKELIQSGAIKGDDEICSGNGYWIYIREQELVAKYIFSDVLQDFNPVQEAKTVVAYQDQINESMLLPEDEDLEYPALDEEESPSDITQVGINLADLKRSLDLDDSDDEEGEFNLSETEEEVLPPDEVPKVTAINVNARQKITPERVGKSRRTKTIFSVKILYVLIVVFFLVAVAALYFRKTLIKSLVNSSLFIPNSHAQSFAPLKKKSG